MKLLREPLVHFLVAGAFLFVVFGVFGSGAVLDGGGVVRVTADDVRRITTTWQRQWGRPPSSSELGNLLDQHVREEILYREAMALGLDADDTIVRRRLVQKIEFLSEDLGVDQEPESAALEAWFETGIESYRIPSRTSFTHVYLSRDRRGATVLSDAEALLEKLRATSPERAPREGDRFMLQYDFAQKSAAEISRDFGGAFAESLGALEPGDWQGPVESGYGVHLVRVLERQPSRLSGLDEVRARVRNDYIANARREVNEEFYADLRERYEVTYDDEIAGLVPAPVGPP